MKSYRARNKSRFPAAKSHVSPDQGKPTDASYALVSLSLRRIRIPYTQIANVAYSSRAFSIIVVSLVFPRGYTCNAYEWCPTKRQQMTSNGAPATGDQQQVTSISVRIFQARQQVNSNRCPRKSLTALSRRQASRFIEVQLPCAKALSDYRRFGCVRRCRRQGTFAAPAAFSRGSRRFRAAPGDFAQGPNSLRPVRRSRDIPKQWIGA